MDYRYSDIEPKIVNYMPNEINGLVTDSLVNISLDLFHEGDRFAGYDLDYDEMAIRNSILNIFTVQRGEVPGKPEFGNPLNLKVFDLFDYFNSTLMRVEIINIINLYEPRIKVEDLRIQELPEYNRIIIQLDYSYVIDNDIRYDTLSIPYAHNNISYLGGRRQPPTFNPASGTCPTRNTVPTQI